MAYVHTYKLTGVVYHNNDERYFEELENIPMKERIKITREFCKRSIDTKDKNVPIIRMRINDECFAIFENMGVKHDDTYFTQYSPWRSSEEYDFIKYKGGD